MAERKEIRIETIDTPKGPVPTVNGLETAINGALDQILPITEVLQSLNEEISSIHSTLQSIDQNFRLITDNIAEVLLSIAKLNSTISDVFMNNQIEKSEFIKSEKASLVELQTILAKLLLELKNNIEELKKTK